MTNIYTNLEDLQKEVTFPDKDGESDQAVILVHVFTNESEQLVDKLFGQDKKLVVSVDEIVSVSKKLNDSLYAGQDLVVVFAPSSRNAYSVFPNAKNSAKKLAAYLEGEARSKTCKNVVFYMVSQHNKITKAEAQEAVDNKTSPFMEQYLLLI